MAGPPVIVYRFSGVAWPLVVVYRLSMLDAQPKEFFFSASQTFHESSANLRTARYTDRDNEFTSLAERSG